MFSTIVMPSKTIGIQIMTTKRFQSKGVKCVVTVKDTGKAFDRYFTMEGCQIRDYFEYKTQIDYLYKKVKEWCKQNGYTLHNS